MPTLKTSVLFVGVSQRPQLALDFECLARLDQISNYPNAEIFVIPSLLAESESFQSFFSNERKKKPQVQILLIVDPKENETSVRTLIHRLPIFRILDSFQDPLLESSLLEALEQAQWLKQNEQLRSLVQEQTERLKNLYQQLEERVSKRTRFLEEARRKNLLAQARWESLRVATVAIHQSNSVAEIEERVRHVLNQHLPIEQIRIFLDSKPEKILEPLTETMVSHQVPLFLEQDTPSGRVAFFRKKDKPFTHEEKETFSQLAEALNPALQRLGKLRIRENLKEEWEATFNAVADPVVILDPQFNILQTNSAFQKKAGQNESLVGQKCYRALFHRDSKCPGCHRGENFRLDQKKETFDVTSQTVLLSPEDEPVFVNQYHDVTEQVRMEKRILESARLAELGTIGSSIAHELNNPLGGILSFVQLIKMDLPSSDPLLPDIEEMERGVLRCRDIVQNLLNFTRSPGQEKKVTLDLREIVKRAISILELKTRSQGIEMKIQMPPTPVWVEGHLNQLTQAVQNVLHSSLISVQEKMMTQKGFQPALEVMLVDQNQEINLMILDNGRGLESAPSLEIPLAQRILLEHGAHLEILSHPHALRMAKISFVRPVLSPEGY